MKRCLYQGVKGCYSYLAAQKFNREFDLIGKKTFAEVFLEDYGIIALENTIVGSIYENYDLLKEHGHTIIGETSLKIEHSLLSVSDDLAQIKRVYSHPKALEQCARFFKCYPHIEKVVHFDTAGAAFDIAKRQNPEEAAIASEQAGKLYGLNILAEKIQDYEDNYTRFALISRKAEKVEKGGKCSLMFTLEHKKGALASVLDAFYQLNLNLTKIESRPLKTRPFEYVFYVDLECEDDKWIYTLPENFSVLGLYQKGML